MPRLTSAAPKYRKHKPTGQAVVTLSGKDFYLGQHGTRASRREYDRLVGEWQAAGRRLPAGESDLTVTELLAAYLRHAKSYYRRADGTPGPVTRELQRVHDDALHGRDPRYADWLDVIEVPTGHPAH